MENYDKDKTAFLNNLLPFMNEAYLRKLFKKFKEITNIAVEYNKWNLPSIGTITFDSKASKANFLEKNNSKNIDEALEFLFNFQNDKQLEIGTDKLIEFKDFEKVSFPIEYDKMINTIYQKSIKEPGLILTNKDMISRQDKVIGYLIKKIGGNLMKGKSIMNISLPVSIFDKRTLHQVFACEMSFASYYLNRAFYSKDALEKIKWIVTFLISHLYLSPLQFKPFSPIIGETLECRIGDMDLYMEQTSSKPLISNFYGIAPNYKIFGYYDLSASTGANSVKANKKGKFIIQFNDGNEYELYLPQVFIKGTTIGKRLFNYKKMCAVLDKKNNLAANVKFNPDEKGFFASIFSSKQKTACDTFIGEIIPYSDFIFEEFLNYGKKKDAKTIASINGSWTENLNIANQEYWKINDFSLIPIYKKINSLLSDSSYRRDLKALIQEDESKSQLLKEEYEEVQRNDRRLREKFLKENKNK